MTKASFNLVLNSIVTSTYTGTRSNPTFNVDWKTLIREEDFNGTSVYDHISKTFFQLQEKL
jgi:hypothetical protein